MADIELVIKISKEDFEIMKHNIAVNNPLCPLSQEEMVSKVAKGIPLPKGHGRLIDADALLRKHPEFDTYPFPSTTIVNAPIIIEAESRNDNLWFSQNWWNWKNCDMYGGE